jgi:hypothetical protein
MELICPICHKTYFRRTGHYNRSIKLGAKLYCSKDCFSAGRKLQFDKHLKTTEQLKAEKAEYDREYRKKNLEALKIKKAEAFKKDYAANPEKYREIRKKRMPQHVIYCRLPKARSKEREARYRRNGQTKLKKCLICKEEKRIIRFTHYAIFPDNRHYMCRECETKQDEELNISTKEVLQCIRSNLHKHQSNLTIRDFTSYPYLIESHKYLLLLKRLTK